jgi:hypothetical protein
MNGFTGTYFDLEDHWARLLGAGCGVKVRVEEIAKTPWDRPYQRSVRWTVLNPNGTSTHDARTFLDRKWHGPRWRRAAPGPPRTSR